MKKTLFLFAKYFFNTLVFRIFIPFIKLLNSITPQQKSNRALIISIFYIGDTLYSTPAIRLLKKNCPKIKIDIFINKNSFPIVEHNPDIDSIFIDNSKITVTNTPFTLFTKLKANLKNILDMINNNYDFVFDVSGGFEAAIFTVLAGRKKKYGVLKELLFKNAYDYYVIYNTESFHLKKMPCAVVRKANLFSDDNNYNYVIEIPAVISTSIDDLLTTFQLNRGLIILAPFAGWYTKEWQLEKFIAIAQRLAKESYFVGIVGSKIEHTRLEKFNTIFNNSIRNFSGITSLLESAAMIKKASLFIGCDSSQSIIAEAFSIPLIKIFGSTNPNYSSPEYQPENQVLFKTINCSPINTQYCSDNPLSFKCPNDHCCMNSISVDEVFIVAIKLLNSNRAINQ